MCERKVGCYPALLLCYYEDTVALQRLQHPEVNRKIRSIVAEAICFFLAFFFFFIRSGKQEMSKICID